MKRAWPLLAAAVAILGGGELFAVAERVPFTTGAYWALTTATTVGYGDVIPHRGAGRVVTVLVMLTAIPILAYVFARAQSMHIRAHLRADLTSIQSSADKAHRIAADTYRHHTGQDHPDAPPGEDTS